MRKARREKELRKGEGNIEITVATSSKMSHHFIVRQHNERGHCGVQPSYKVWVANDLAIDPLR